VLWTAQPGAELSTTGVAVEGNNLYFATSGLFLGNGSIWRCTLPACADPIVLTTTLSTGQIVAEAGQLIWAEPGHADAALYTCNTSLGLCQPGKMVEGEATGLAWEGGVLTYTTAKDGTGYVWQCDPSKQCGQPVQVGFVLQATLTGVGVVPPGNPYDFLLTTGQGKLLGTKNGFVQGELYSVSQDSLVSVVLDGNDIAYFTDRGGIYRCSLSQDCLDFNPLENLTDGGILAIDAGYLYLADGSLSAPRVVRYKLP
jgi:hypothetical protein